MNIRKAEAGDISAVSMIYEKIHDREEAGLTSIGWIRGVYPTRRTALDALQRGDLFVLEDDCEVPAGERSGDEEEPVGRVMRRICGAALINQQQVDVYAQGKWRCRASDAEVMVLHTLVIDPDLAGRGYGSTFVDYYEAYAAAAHCRDLRMDTNARNTAARRLYSRRGYEEIGIVPCTFNGIEGVQLVLLEKVLPQQDTID